MKERTKIKDIVKIEVVKSSKKNICISCKLEFENLNNDICPHCGVRNK